MLSTFKIETFEDILKALRERPDWLEELRRIILTEELIAFPSKFEKFKKEEFQPLKQEVKDFRGEFEKFKKEEFQPLKQEVKDFRGEFEKFKKEEFQPLKQEVKDFRGEFEKFKKEEFQPLKEKVDKIEQDVAVLKQDVAVLKQDVADLKGDNFERKVREKAPSYFGRFIRKCKVITPEELADILDDAMDSGIISEQERDDTLNTDVVVQGVLKHDREKKVVLVTEVSIKADRSDVERAALRSKVIEKTLKVPAIAIVIGKEFTEGAEVRAKELEVILC
ncbi:MAG: hypothetical protein ACK4TF_04260 [Thermodesulfovibrionales bacterium]